MTAFNVVRFRVKPGYEEQFVEEHRKVRPAFKGFLAGSLIKTGDQTFCMVGEWKTFKNLANARAEMIGILDKLRPMLEDLGGDLGVTDPVSGEVVAKLRAPAARAAAKPASRPRKAKKAKKTSAKRRR